VDVKVCLREVHELVLNKVNNCGYLEGQLHVSVTIDDYLAIMQNFKEGKT
jgi:hypothetical protein